MNTYDVSTAFLHAPLTEDTYVLPPKELIGTKYCKENHCWKLNKALYGLRTAPLSWNKHITEVLTGKLDFRRTKADCCLYCNDKRGILLLLYVDDLLVLTRTEEEADWFYKALSKEVLLKKTGTLEASKTVKFLGRKITHRGDNVLLQPLDNYTYELLRLYNLENCRSLNTTGTNANKPTVEDEEPLNPQEHALYRTAVGKLQWLVPLRPDLAFATKELARGLASPTVQHRTALKHTLRFLAGTAGTGLMLKPATTLSKETRHKAQLTIYTNSDWAGCKTTRKSTTGTVILLGCTIPHCSRTQMTLALSSTEAETYAVCTGLSEALFLRQLLLETKLFTTVELHLYTDSTGAKEQPY